MKISLSVEHPREAGYATLMFKALQVAMLADPPPVHQTTHNRVGDVSHAVFTGGVTSDVDKVLHPFGSAEANAANAADEAGQPISPTKQTAVEILDAEKAAEAKKRGRKSNADKEAAAAAKAAGQENALRPGEALKGVNAQTLAAALEGLPLVHESGGVQVRVAPDTPLDEIAAIRGQMDAQAKAADAKAAAQTSAATEVKTATPPPAATAQTGGTIAGMDDDLASLFRKKAEETPPASVTAGVSRFAGMTGPQLMKEFTGYINGDGGLFWARAVMAHYHIEALDDLTEVQIRDALENPGQFKSAAA